MKMPQTLLVVLIIFQSLNADIKPSFADNVGHSEIRSASLRKNDRMYNKMAIDLVNGKSRQVSIDRMIRVLKKYNVVEFGFDHMDPTKDLILREVAFRMLKDHYLPRASDRIKVHRRSSDFSKEAGIHSYNKSTFQPKLELAVGVATIKENKKMDTLYWADMVSQVSSAVEMLWANRINNSDPEVSDSYDRISLIEALGILNNKYLLERPLLSKDSLAEKPASKEIIKAIDEVLNRWHSEGSISNKEIPVLALLIKQYVLLNISSDPVAIAMQIKQIKDISVLHDLLIERINVITQYIKINNPSDYAAFAMLNSLLSEISDHIYSLSKKSAIGSSQLKTQLEKPRFSA